MQRIGVHPGVFVDTLWPTARRSRDALLVLGGSLLIALAAQLYVPLPFSPVPITGQTFAVLLLGALYGSRRGAATTLTYLALGALGGSVFFGGAGGIGHLLGPTGGYLTSYVPVAFLVGWLSERGWDRRAWTAALSMLAGNLLIYVCGVLWLSRFVGWDAVFSAGVWPFLPGDLIKIALATILLPTAWRLVGGRGRDSDA